jgi:eukaryotic-like serine/threonine-protein kinase
VSENRGLPTDGTFSFGSDTDAVAARLAQQRLEGKYRIIRVISNGGMGLIYLAVQIGLTLREVAIKTILPAFLANEVVVRRFEAEVKLLTLLDHPNLIPVLDSGCDPHFGPYVVLPVIRGQTIEQFVESHRRGGHLPDIGVLVKLALDIANGLNYLHVEKHIVHRDVSARNILVKDGREPVAVVIDLGIGRLLADEERLTATDVFIGAPSYASPEQLEKRRDVGPPADWYSFGMILYSVLSGRHPFTGVNRRAAPTEMSFVPLQLFRPAVPAPLADLIARLTAYHPAERPCGAEVVVELERLHRSLCCARASTGTNSLA